MKRILILLAFAAVGFTACDFLDREPLSEMTEDIYFKTAEEMMAEKVNEVVGADFKFGKLK